MPPASRCPRFSVTSEEGCLQNEDLRPKTPKTYKTLKIGSVPFQLHGTNYEQIRGGGDRD